MLCEIRMSRRSLALRRLRNRTITLIRHPVFWGLTIVGNSSIVLGSFILYHLESHSQTRTVDYIDCVIWATGMVTTVGSDLTPHTVFGKFTIMILMILGSLFMWSYMALLVTALIAPELSILKKEIHDIEKEIHFMKPE